MGKKIPPDWAELGDDQIGRRRWRLGEVEFDEVSRELRVRDYSRAMVLPNSLKAAIVPFIARARVRTGFTGEFRYGLLNDARRLDRNKLPRTIERFVALALNVLEVGHPPSPDLGRPVRRVHSDHVDTGVEHSAHLFGLFPGRSQGGDNFGATVLSRHFTILDWGVRNSWSQRSGDFVAMWKP